MAIIKIIIINRKMNKNFMKELNILLNVANELSLCSLKNCKDSTIKVKENKELVKLIPTVMFSSDIKEKNKLIKKITSNQDIINNELCIFNSCKDIYIKLLNILIPLFEKILVKSPSKEMTGMLNQIKKLVEKDNLTKKDLINLQKHKTYLMLTLMSAK